MLSLSTCCFGNAKMSTAEVLAEVGRLGFASIEWGVGAVRLDEAEVAAAVRAGDVTVTSVHALAGLEGGTGINVQGGDIASRDARRREATIEATCRTIDLARRLNVGAVVLHAGGVEGLLYDQCVEVMRNWKQMSASPTFHKKLEQLRVLRRQEAPEYVRRTIESLAEVVRRAGEFPLGLETRYVYSQVPLPDELEGIWAALGRDCFGYWHDVGHARIQQLFGAVPEEAWLDRFADRLLGVHLHDMIGTRDHMPPGQGELDLASVAAGISGRPCARVMELSSVYLADAIVAGRKHLESLGLA